MFPTIISEQWLLRLEGAGCLQLRVQFVFCGDQQLRLGHLLTEWGMHGSEEHMDRLPLLFPCWYLFVMPVHHLLCAESAKTGVKGEIVLQCKKPGVS